MYITTEILITSRKELALDHHGGGGVPRVGHPLRQQCPRVGRGLIPVDGVKGGDGAVVSPDNVEGVLVLSNSLPSYSCWKWIG